MINGIDVSHWEPVINWHQVKDAGYGFAFIKASQVGKDGKFDEHWMGAKEVGLPRGAYHFYDPSINPKKQAETFYHTMNGDYGELPFVLDLEGFTSGPYYGSNNWYNYLEHLKNISGNHPIMIYTGYYYWNDNVFKAPAVQDVHYFKQYPLWIANYSMGAPLVPPPWYPDWMFWQYSENGTVSGVYDELGRPTNCDLDYFYGTKEQFQELLNLSTQPPQWRKHCVNVLSCKRQRNH